MEPQSGKNSKKIGEMTFGGGFFCKCCHLKYIGMIIHKCRLNVLHSDEHTQLTVQWCSLAQMATPNKK